MKNIEKSLKAYLEHSSTEKQPIIFIVSFLMACAGILLFVFGHKYFSFYLISPLFFVAALVIFAISKGKKSKGLFVAIYLGITFICLFLSARVHQAFGIVTDIFAISAIVIAIQAQQKRLQRSTIYLLISIALGTYGGVSVFLGFYTHITPISATFLVFIVALLMGIAFFATILCSGEILKASGIGKLFLLIVVGLLIVSFISRVLDRVRIESHKIDTPETKMLELTGDDKVRTN